jgi:aubergine-like protein
MFRVKKHTRHLYMFSRIFFFSRKHYDIDIKDMKQPLLLHRAKTKAKQSQQAGAGAQPAPNEIICLIPELCFMTGLTEAMRTDMNVKKELGAHTRLSPSQRYEQVRVLLDQIRSTKAALRHITDWGLQLDDDLNIMEGRIVPNEKIMFARREVETDFRCDWTRSCATEECVKGVEIKNWLCVYPESKAGIVERFAQLANEAGKRIGVKIGIPFTVGLRDDKPDTYYNEIRRNLNDQVIK